MSKLAKVKNRMISIVCIVFFSLGAVLLTLVSIKLINEYNTHQELLDKRDELLEEKEYQDNLPTDEDYYTVYVKDNYSIYDTEDTIFVFTK
ncbi:MAG: hypothetical protein E7177_00520 [Erysipelotrichaceae bacterium]|nr:hypothetical protein [Erysipelotrichaceae bacterium]